MSETSPFPDAPLKARSVAATKARDTRVRGPGSGLSKGVSTFAAGLHACLIYDDPAEQLFSLGPFIREGLEGNEQVLYVADDHGVNEFGARLAQHGIDVGRERASGRLQLVTRAEWRQAGALDPARKAEQFRGYVRAAQNAGYRGIRFGVEMTWTLNPAIDTRSLEQWEATINTLIDGKFPVRIICQYSRTRLAEDVLLAALHTHPWVIDGQDVHRNPFYKAPVLLEAAGRKGTGLATTEPNGRGAETRESDWIIAQLRFLTTAAREKEHLLSRAHEDRSQLATEKRHSDALCRTIVESSRDCIKTLALDGTLLSINEAASDILCIADLSAVVGKLWIDFWDGADRDAARAAVTAAASGGKGRFVGHFPVAGEPRWWDVMVTPIRDEAGHPERLLAVSRDVTEQRLALDKVRQSEARLATFLEDATVGLHRVGPDGTILWANRAELELLGYRADEYVGHHISRFHADQRVIEDILARLLRGERLQDFPARLVARDGSIRHVLIDSCVRWEDGKFIHTQCFTRDVTAARRAEAEIRASEERLRRLLSLMPVAVYTIDVEGRITFYNQHAVDLWGREPAQGEAAPRFCNAFGLWLPDGEPLPLMATPIVEAVRSGKSTRNGDVIFGRPDGSRVRVSVNIEPLRDESGKIVGAINVVQDVTMLKHREEEIARLNSELRQRLEEFEALIRTAPIGIGVASDAKCDTIWGNPAFEEMLRVPAKANLSKSGPEGETLPFVVRRNGQPVPHHDLPMQRAARLAIDVAAEELEIIRSDGSIMHELAFAAPLFDPKGKVRGCVGVFLDITRQKEVDAALRRSEALFRQLADSMPQMVWAARPDGYVDYYNRRWYDYTGFDETYGDASWEPIIHPDDVARAKAVYYDAIRAESLYEVEYRLKDRTSGGYRWFLGRALPIRDENGNVIRWFGTCTDIDDQKRAAEKLERAVADRTETLRATIGELEAFSYSISHDLRGPLRSMQGFAEVLEEDCAAVLGAEGREYLERIRAAARQMDRLIQDVLTLSRAARAELALEPVALDPLVRGILQSYPNLHARQATIVIEGELPWVQGNPAALTQCFSNLLGNAVKFVPPSRQPEVRISCQATGDFVRVHIADNGIGIPADAHERIFRMFERLEPLYEGTGIGLSIVKTTVMRLGGKVGVYSQPGRGSTFWVELRAATTTLQPANIPPSQ